MNIRWSAWAISFAAFVLAWPAEAQHTNRVVRRMGMPPAPEIRTGTELSKLPVLSSQPFFGIALGESGDVTANHCRVAGLTTTNEAGVIQVGPEKRTVESLKTLRIKGSLSKNEAVEETAVTCFKGHVWKVAVIFKDKSKENVETLRRALAGKYLTKASSIGKYGTRIDNMPVTIEQNLGTVTYSYDAITEVVTAELEHAKSTPVRDKGGSIQDEL